MGGPSSGRRRTTNRASIEHTCCLDIRQIRRAGGLRLGERVVRTCAWTQRVRLVGSGTIDISLGQDGNGSALLTVAVDGSAHTQTVTIEAVRCRYGGYRHYFICPETGRRCEVLCLWAGSFASRQAQRLTYQSQSETELNRMVGAKGKLQARLDGEDGRGKPRGANRRRLMSRWLELEMAVELAVDAEMNRRFGGWSW